MTARRLHLRRRAPQTNDQKNTNHGRRTRGLTKIFRPLTPYVVNKVANALIYTRGLRAPGDRVSWSPGGVNGNNLLPRVPITRAMVAEIVAPVPGPARAVVGAAHTYFPIPGATVSIYLQMVCDHANKKQPHVRRHQDLRHGRNSIPAFAHLPINFYTPRPGGVGARPEGDPWYAAASLQLNALGLTRRNFLVIKQILVPIEIIVTPATAVAPAVIHHVLVVIAPTTKSIELWDSSPDLPDQDYILPHFCHLLAIHLGRDFWHQKWMRRQDMQFGENYQDDPSYSSIHVMTTALRVAMGYNTNDNILARSGVRDYEVRRQRIQADILKGHFSLSPKTVANEYYYGCIHWNEKFRRSASDGWKPFNAIINNNLPLAHRGRTWLAQKETKATILALCRANKASRARFAGFNAQSKALTLDGFKDWFEGIIAADGRGYPV